MKLDIKNQNKTNIILDKAIRLEISEECLEAYLFINFLILKDEFNPSYVMSLLKNTKILEEMIQKDAIEKLSIYVNHRPESLVRILIARGIAPKLGRHGYRDFLYPFYKPLDITVNETKFDKKYNHFQRVRKGDLLLKITTGYSGAPGKDIFGDPIQADPVNSPSISFKKNIQIITEDLGEEKLFKYYSEIDGILDITDKSISVLPEEKIHSENGHVIGEFDSSVYVNGILQEGSSMHVGGKLKVDGNVEGVELQVQGDLIVGGGIKGNLLNKIIVKGNLFAKYIEDSEVEVEGDIILHGGILNSSIRCLGSIYLTDPVGTVSNGKVLSSQITCFKSIHIDKVGSNQYKKTLIEVGYHFKNDLLYQEVTRKIKELEKKLAIISPDVKKMNIQVTRLKTKLSVEQTTILKKLITEINLINEELELLKRDSGKLDKGRYNNKQVYLIVEDEAHPGVTLKFREKLYLIEKYSAGLLLTTEPSIGNFSVETYKEINP